jgi:hypothetical protein
MPERRQLFLEKGATAPRCTPRPSRHRACRRSLWLRATGEIPLFRLILVLCTSHVTMSKPLSTVSQLWALLTHHRGPSSGRQRAAKIRVTRDSKDTLATRPLSRAQHDDLNENQHWNGTAYTLDEQPTEKSSISSPLEPQRHILPSPESWTPPTTVVDETDGNRQASISPTHLPPPSPHPPASNQLHECPGSSNSDCTHCQKLIRAQQKLARLRDEVLTTRTHVNNERRIYIQLREYALEVQSKFMSTLDTAISNGTLVADQPTLNDLHKQILVSNSELLEQEEHFKDHEDRLSTLEYRFGKKEAAQYQKASCERSKLAIAGEANLDDAVDDDEDDDETATNDSESEDQPSLLEAYYDRAGDVTVQKDRLDEFEADHRTAVRLRVREVQAGGRPEPPEKKFLEDYFEKRAKIIRNYLKAKHDAQQLRQQCLERDYHIAEEDEIEVGPRPIDLSRRYPEGPLSKKVDPGVRPLELLLFGTVDPEDRVREWLADSLRARSGANYRRTLWETRKTHSEGDPELHTEQAVATEDAKTVEENVNSPLVTRFEAVESSWGLKSSIGTFKWPGEILRHRYSNPELRHVEHAENQKSPRSVC